MPRSRNQSRREAPIQAAPPPQRASHDRVVRSGRVLDAAGNAGFPFRVIGTLEAMEASGRIDADMARAGVRFHDNFHRAGFGERDLRAHWPTGLPAAGIASACADGSDRARRAVAAAIRQLGGGRAHAADIAWHVLGLEWSVRRWARERWHTVSCHGSAHIVASGILIAALGILAAEKNR
jgi:hypothetical protein